MLLLAVKGKQLIETVTGTSIFTFRNKSEELTFVLLKYATPTCKQEIHPIWVATDAFKDCGLGISLAEGDREHDLKCQGGELDEQLD